MASGRKILRSNEKGIIYNTLQHFKDSGTEGNSLKLTAAATGVSERTVLRIRKEFERTGRLASPTRTPRAPYKPIDEFDRDVLRSKVREFYTVRRHLPTLRKLHTVIKEEINYPGSIQLMRETLKDMGFGWKNTQDHRKILIEKPAIVGLRLAFYVKRKELEDKGYTFVYVDETWIDTAYTMKRCWQGPGVEGVIPPCNRGQRLIVVHAGTRHGFVQGAKLVYKAASTTGDYHREMNGTNFIKWLQEKLLPNLTGRCAIVLDNASYHSMQENKCPTSSTRKDDIKTWLRTRGITFEDTMLKPQLLQIAKMHKPAPTYVIDQLIRQQGHEILRLPPYHPEFNAIELIWSQVKFTVRQRNVTFRLDDTLKLTDLALDQIGEDRWRDACGHVDKKVQLMKDADHYIDDSVQPFVIRVGDTSSDSETDTASESEL